MNTPSTIIQQQKKLLIWKLTNFKTYQTMTREEFKEKAKQGIDDLFTKIDELEKKKDDVTDDLKSNYNEQITELNKRKDELKSKFLKLMGATDKDWEEHKSSFNSTYDTFKEGYYKLSSFFK